jgi:5-methylcytosine-specific restriction endonuclease McrA
MSIKICTKCKKPFPATAEFFRVDNRNKNGLGAQCRSCYRKQTCEWQKDNKTICNKKSQRWKKKNPDKLAAIEAGRRARKLNQTPDLTQEEKCQIELIYKKSQKLGPNWQVDHIIPLSKGGLHHPDNLQIVTKTYNLHKSYKLNFRLPTNKEIFIVGGG